MKYPSPTASRADLTLTTDYYPFGSAMPGRSFSTGEYRFGFNGMEGDDELSGDGNSCNFGARMYDARLGRWLSVDPVFKANESPFAAFSNSPPFYIDKNGQDTLVVHSQKLSDNNDGQTVIIKITLFIMASRNIFIK